MKCEVIPADSKTLLGFLLFFLSVQLLHKLSVRAADGPQRLLRMIKNPVSDHLPAGCPRYATSFKAGDAVCPRSLVPKEGPAVVVIGAFAHGAVGLSSHLLVLGVSHTTPVILPQHRLSLRAAVQNVLNTRFWYLIGLEKYVHFISLIFRY